MPECKGYPLSRLRIGSGTCTVMRLTLISDNNREYKQAHFWYADGYPKRTFRTRVVLSPRFLYYPSLIENRYLAMWMWLCEGKLRVKIAHFRLPSMSYCTVGDCLQDLTTNTLTRNPDFFYFIDHRKRSLPARDYKVPFNFSSCSNVSFITVNYWFGFQLKCSKVQGYQIPTRDLSRHCT